MTDMHERSEPPPVAIPVDVAQAIPLSDAASARTAAHSPAGGPPTVLGYAGMDGVRAAVWRRGKLIVFRKNTALPFRCVKCNAPAHGKPLRSNLSWHPPAIYLTILIGLIIYVIVALCVQKSARISFGLCARHRRRRARVVAVSWLFALTCVSLIVCSIPLDNPAFAVLGLLILILGLVLYLIFARSLTAARIDNEWVWLRGAGEEFLDTLPSAA